MRRLLVKGREMLTMELEVKELGVVVSGFKDCPTNILNNDFAKFLEKLR